MFVDFEYYENTYKGTEVNSSSFPSYELKARLTIENYCLKPKEDYEKVLQGEFKDFLKVATCELIDSIKNYEKSLELAKKGNTAQIMGIESESIKDHSVKYSGKNTVKQLEASLHDQQVSIMRKYLLRTGLLARGL